MNKQLSFFLGVLFIVACGTDRQTYRSWEVYGGSEENIKYSALDEINITNVSRLDIVWEYASGEASETNGTDMKTNPIIVDGVLYGLNPQLKLFALDAASGKELWVFDPGEIPVQGGNIGRGPFSTSTKISRGLAFYDGGENDQRIFYSPGGGHTLHCIDANTGKMIHSFGSNGIIDLHDDLDVENAHDLHISNTSPGIIFEDLIIVGSRLSESAQSLPGHIRAYDVHSGKRRWIFHTIPHPREKGHETWHNPEAYKYVGGANVWGGFSLDKQRGIVFAGTGSATPDFYGAYRGGDNLFANCVLALDARTGKLLWHYQTVRHDLWDWDLASHPILATVKKDGRDIDVVVQVTKHGFIFVLDRETGKPVYPVEDVPVPSSDLVGEKSASTQPVPTFYKPFVRQVLTESDLFRDHLPDSSYQRILQQFRSLKTDNMFNPPSLQGTLQNPGWNGGAEWGGPSYDPATGVMYVNANESPWIMQMVKVEDEKVQGRRDLGALYQTNREVGILLYRQQCSSCHGMDMGGGETNPSLATYPSLKNLSYDEESFKSLIATGRNTMPPFSHLSDEQRTAIASYVLNLEWNQKERYMPSEKERVPEYLTSPYRVIGGKFLTPEGYPAVTPPWGHLSAIDLNTGKTLWKVPLGDYPELKAKGIHAGSENFGGPVVTAGGLVFIAATRDEKFRAFDKKTGKLLWEVDLPAAGIATPAVYAVNNKQYVVIACGGGGKQRTKSGDKYVAFALPD